MFSDNPLNALNYPIPLLNRLIEKKIKKETEKAKEQNKTVPLKLGKRLKV